MKPNKEMKELRKAIEKLEAEYGITGTKEGFKLALVNLFTERMGEVIGEDEKLKGDFFDGDIGRWSINDLRQEMRSKLK